jgi:hypothetical protein
MADNQFLSQLAVLNYVPLARLDDLRAELHAARYQILGLDGVGVRDASGFFTAASAQLFTGERISNWDSFADMLANHATVIESPRTAFIWTEAQQMLDGRLRDLVTAANVLTGIARDAYADSRRFVTFLAGAGPNFA